MMREGGRRKNLKTKASPSRAACFVPANVGTSTPRRGVVRRVEPHGATCTALVFAHQRAQRDSQIISRELCGRAAHVLHRGDTVGFIKHRKRVRTDPATTVDAGATSRSRAHARRLPPVFSALSLHLLGSACVPGLRRALRGRLSLGRLLRFPIRVDALGSNQHQRRHAPVQAVVTHAPDEELLDAALAVRRHDHARRAKHLRVVADDLADAPVVGIAAGDVDDVLDVYSLEQRDETLRDESLRAAPVLRVPRPLVGFDLLPERGAGGGHGRVVGLRGGVEVR
mmetsp:Transcript_1734/g.7183  ORF Transcript_1734/g.7183 Transcript_1734/m.7183 type:complete len:283 (+) Transcript_1734:325-1173(+)